MPYSGIPASMTDKMDRCFVQVMADPKMKGKYSNFKERKSHAIAICHASLMGKGNFDLVLKENLLKDVGKEVKDMDTKKIDKLIEKAGEADNEVKEMRDCVAKYMKEGKSMKESIAQCKIDLKGEEKGEPDEKVAKADEPKSDAPEEVAAEEVKPVEEAKSDEEVAPTAEVTPKEAPVEESPVKEEAPVEEAPKEEAKVEKTEEVIPQEASIMEKVNQVMTKVEEILAKVEEKKAEPVEVKEEEVAKVSQDSESRESLEKVADSVQKVAGKVEELSQTLSKLDERLVKIEEQPVPSKVASPVVVSKGGDSTPKNDRVEEIKTELSKLEEFKRTNLEEFQKQRLSDKAYNLIAERDQLLGL